MYHWSGWSGSEWNMIQTGTPNLKKKTEMKTTLGVVAITKGLACVN